MDLALQPLGWLVDCKHCWQLPGECKERMGGSRRQASQLGRGINSQ
jgi:hypothetical protein